jgi:hypothetical protein
VPGGCPLIRRARETASRHRPPGGHLSSPDCRCQGGNRVHPGPPRPADIKPRGNLRLPPGRRRRHRRRQGGREPDHRCAPRDPADRMGQPGVLDAGRHVDGPGARHPAVHRHRRRVSCAKAHPASTRTAPPASTRLGRRPKSSASSPASSLPRPTRAPYQAWPSWACGAATTPRPRTMKRPGGSTPA